jgi:hypothetical protein
MKRLFICLCMVVCIYSCKTNTDYKAYLHDPQLFSNAVHEMNSVVMGNNFPPMVAARNYTYGAIAAYEVIAAGYPNKYQSLAGQLHGLKDVPKPLANSPIDFELAALLTYIKVGEAVTFPEGSMQEYKDSILKLARDKGLPGNIEKASQEFADAVGSSIIDWSKKDNYAETRSAEKFTVKDEPGRWVPTPPMYGQATEPHWMNIRTLVLDSNKQFTSPPPIAFNITDKNSPYYKQVITIKNAIDSLTDEQKHMAEFWDDNPFKLNVSGHVMFGTKKFSPSGHWMSIVGIAAGKAKADYATTVFAFAKTAIGLFDAFIQCWEIKYTYNTVRPETVINKYLDPNWRPYLQTPAFPEYTCGHCTISASAAEVLTNIFGDNFAYTDSWSLESKTAVLVHSETPLWKTTRRAFLEEFIIIIPATWVQKAE